MTLKSTFDRQQYNRDYEGQLSPRSETKSNQASAVTLFFTLMQKPYNPLSNIPSYHYAHLWYDRRPDTPQKVQSLSRSIQRTLIRCSACVYEFLDAVDPNLTSSHRGILGDKSLAKRRSWISHLPNKTHVHGVGASRQFTGTLRQFTCLL